MPQWKHKNFVTWDINANVFSQANETSNKLKLQRENFQLKKQNSNAFNYKEKHVAAEALTKKNLKKIKFVGSVSLCIRLYLCVCVSDTESHQPLIYPQLLTPRKWKRILFDVKISIRFWFC